MNHYGLIGYPLTHSFSQNYFEKKFQLEGDNNSRYSLFPIKDISQFPKLLQSQPYLRGLNVTIPYKQSVIAYLSETDAVVKTIGACNVIVIGREKTIGYNTDYIGFQVMVNPYLSLLKGSRALVLGTGGSARAVRFALRQMGFNVATVSRSGMQADYTYSQLDTRVFNQFHLLVNTTPLGMYPDAHLCPPIPYDALHADMLVVDLIYNPEETLLLQKAKIKGCTVCNGLRMLEAQADAAWHIWQQVAP